MGAHSSTALALDSFTTFPISDTTHDALHKYLAIDIIFANCCKILLIIISDDPRKDIPEAALSYVEGTVCVLPNSAYGSSGPPLKTTIM